MSDESKVYYNLKWKSGNEHSFSKQLAKIGLFKGLELTLMALIGGGIGLIGGL